MLARVTYSLFVMWLSCVAVNANAASEGPRRLQLEGVANAFRSAVLTKSTSQILALISKRGLACADGIVTRKEIETDLANDRSMLYTFLFRPKEFEASYGARYSSSPETHPISLIRFFRRARDLQTHINFMVIRGKLDLNYACIRYHASNFAYSPEVCFAREHNTWVLSQSLYDCD